MALAFCAADVLLEVDKDHKIVYAAGATVALTGVVPQDLNGRALLDIITQDDRALLSELIRGMGAGKRLDPVPMRLVGADGPTPRLLLTGYLLPELPDSLFFALRLGADARTMPVLNARGRDPGTGLYDGEVFAKLAGERIQAAKRQGDGALLTMLRLEGYARVSKRLGKDAGEQLDRTISACLRVGAGASDTVGRFDPENYGFVHKPGVDIDDIRGRIEQHIKDTDPEGVGVGVRAGTISPDGYDVSDLDLIKALHFTIRQFCAEDDAEIAIASMSDNLHHGVEENSRKLTDFKAIVSESNFDVAFQPIVDISTRRISHYEALARFGGGSERSPYEFITFAEDTGLSCDFDFAMCQKLIAWLTRQNEAGNRFRIAMNLSGRSVDNTAFLAAIQNLLDAHGDIRAQLLIEITESARISDLNLTNRFIQSLRKSGHMVCLDDFGAGAAALRYLHDLDVDVVKIDGQYIQGAAKSRKMRAFLKAIAGLCTELGITTVGEMVEDEETVEILKSCKIAYGQGYFYGRPSLDLDDFKELAASAPPAKSGVPKSRTN